MTDRHDGLRLVVGEGRGGEPPILTAEDLPLGPLAGRTITAWITPSSGTCHLDKECAPRSAKPKSFEQPSSGTFADRVWPGRAHCRLPGKIGDYIAAAEALIYGAAAIVNAERDWKEGVAGYSVLGLRSGYGPGFSRIGLSGMPSDLEPAADRLAERIAPLRRQILRESLHGYEEHLELAAAAEWVTGGRTPGKYQHRYETALDVTQTALEQAFRASENHVGDTMAPPKDANGWDVVCAELERQSQRPWHSGVYARDLDVTEFWFDLVADGVPPERATRALTRRVIDKLLWRVRHGFADEREQRQTATLLPVWATVGSMIGEALTGYLAGIVTPKRGSQVVVAWHRSHLGLGSLAKVVSATLPAVRAFDGEDELRVACLPATFGPLLEDERDHGRSFRLVIPAAGYLAHREAVLVAFADALVEAKGRTVAVPAKYGEPSGRALRAKVLPEFGFRGMTVAQAAMMLEAAKANHGYGKSRFEGSAVVLRAITDHTAP